MPIAALGHDLEPSSRVFSKLKRTLPVEGECRNLGVVAGPARGCSSEAEYPYRLVWLRSLPSQGRNTGSNPVGDTKHYAPVVQLDRAQAF